MSTLGQPNLEPAWKQEVARRLAAHKNRKGASAHDETPSQQQHYGNSMAAEAAARVAARYAKAPTYSQMQAEEARMAVRAAEIATQVALEAQAAAEEALAELHAATEPQRGPAVVESITRGRVEAAEEVAVAFAEPVAAETVSEPWPDVALEIAAANPIVPIAPEPEAVITTQVVDGQSFGIRWEPDAPVRRMQPKATPAPEPFELETEDWWTPAQMTATLRNEPIAVETEAGTANLIEFPRELVATRKMRPRLLEPAQTVTAERQLSIFEVDPGSVSTEAELEQGAAWAHREEWTAPLVRAAGPEWSGIELDEHPLVEKRPEPAPVRAPQQIHLSPLGNRLMAMAVDGCLVMALFFVSAMVLAARVQQPLSAHGIEMFVFMGMALAGFIYNALFMSLGVSTPGMRYAGVAFCTFDEEVPTRAQLRRRLGAMVLSLAPVGVGLVWSVFDEDHLSWHDRISGTYLRKR